MVNVAITFVPVIILYFIISRYTLSLPPFVWKDLTDDPSNQKIVHCKDKNSVGKPFYISVSFSDSLIM